MLSPVPVTKPLHIFPKTPSKSNAHLNIASCVLYSLTAAILSALIMATGMTRTLWGANIPPHHIHILLFALATPVQFLCGWRFLKGAWAALRHRTADMNSLIAAGTLAAYFYSAAVTFAPLGTQNIQTYFDTSAMIITLVLLGRLLETRARGQTSSAIRKLLDLRPKNRPHRPQWSGC